MNHSVRRATAADARELAQLLIDFNTEFDSPASPLDVLAPRVERLLAGPGYSAWLAGDPAIAFATLSERASSWYDGPVRLLEDFYVRPELRSQGIGSALLAAFIADARATGVASLEINVDESDLDTMRFYERHGFAGRDPDSGERGYYFFREL